MGKRSGVPHRDDELAALSRDELLAGLERSRTRLAEALGVLDADMDGASWYAIARCLYFALADAGLPVLDAWSAAGDKYKEGEPASLWERFAQEEGFSAPPLAWLLRKARKAAEQGEHNVEVNVEALMLASIEEVSEDHAVVTRGAKTVVVWEQFDPRAERYSIQYLDTKAFVDKLVRKVAVPNEQAGKPPKMMPVGKLWHGSAWRRQYDGVIFAASLLRHREPTEVGVEYGPDGWRGWCERKNFFHPLGETVAGHGDERIRDAFGWQARAEVVVVLGGPLAEWRHRRRSRMGGLFKLHMNAEALLRPDGGNEADYKKIREAVAYLAPPDPVATFRRLLLVTDEVLAKNWPNVRRLATLLLERGTIGEDELYGHFERYPAVPYELPLSWNETTP